MKPPREEVRGGGLALLRFRVQGSATDPYEVLFTKDGSRLTASCTCPAGLRRQHCKHRMRLLFGQVDGLVSGNEAEVNLLADWLEGSELQLTLTKLHEAELRVVDAQRVLTAMKAAVARTLNG